MAISVFPVPVTVTGEKALSITATSANTLYQGTVSITPGLYRITCTSTTIASVSFFNGSGLIGTATTASGTVDFNLSTAATKVTASTNTGSSITIAINFLSYPIVSSLSGTLTTITSSGTYSTLGNAYVVAVGGGGGGGSYGGNSPGLPGYTGGGGGGSGGVTGGIFTITSPVTVTIGDGGAGNANGGTTTFLSLTATGGTTGALGGGSTNGAGGAAGTPNGGAGGAGGGGGGTPGSASGASPYPFVKSGTTGGGGGGYYNGVSAGGGSGIGTGNGTGYGAGGHGGGPGGPGAGTGGVVYVLGGI
jgi:hypothetical protein